MTDHDLEQMAARVAAATAGPWVVKGRYHLTGPPAGDYPGATTTIVRVRADQQYRRPGEDAANALFIAHARQDIEDLIAEVRRLRGLA